MSGDWDELGSAEDLLTESDTLLEQDEADKKNNKKRRKSTLIQESQSAESIEVIGYSARLERINDSESQDHNHVNNEEKQEFNRLFAKGVYLLSMREHSVQELTDKLKLKSEFSDIVYAVIDELIENKYLSDERFAESYVRSRANKGFGPIKIRTELKTKGINNVLIGDYLDMNSPIWFDNAREQYHKKYGEELATDYKEWSKRARFMQSRGFNMEHIQVIMPSPEFG